MARPLRIEIANGWYHVTARGTERREVFTQPAEYAHFVDRLEEWVGRFGLVLHAYVLMPNHYHLLVQTPQANLSAAMQWLQTSYAMWFNRRHRRVGPLFQGRFKAFVLDPEEAAWPVSRYMHLNPVRTAAMGLSKRQRPHEEQGLVQPTQEMLRLRRETLESYRWSSYALYAGRGKAQPWVRTDAVLMARGRGTVKELKKRYRQYVESGVSGDGLISPWTDLEAGLLYGGEQFVNRMKELLHGDRREQPEIKAAETRPAFEAIIYAVERLKDEKWDVFRDRHGDSGRDLALYVGRMYGGLQLKALGEAAGGLDYATVATAVRRLGHRLARERCLQKELKAILQMTNVKT